MCLLDLDLTVDYPDRQRVLDHFQLRMERGEAVALVGESGSGKSTLALAILGLLDFKRGRATGRILFEDVDLIGMNERDFRRIRGRRIGLVLQSPHAALNPMLRIESHFREAWRAHSSRAQRDWRPQGLPLLERVCLPTCDDFLKRRPRELSVGQAQRVLIALALLHRPSLVIADEPTSALDVITQSEILALFRDLNRELGTAMLVISHDLLSITHLASRVAILKNGRLVETGPVKRVFTCPEHPYTRALVKAIPTLSFGNSPHAVEFQIEN
jgi:ABC-type glutathione transport system ATPase component